MNEKDTVVKEQVNEEKPPSDLSDQIGRFREDQAKKDPSIEKEKDPKLSEEAKVKTTDEKNQSDKEKIAAEADKIKDPDVKKAILRLVNEAGEDVPFPFKVDGKDLEESDIEKIRTYVQMGYHGNVRNEDLKKREADLEKGAQLLMKVMETWKPNSQQTPKETSAKEKPEEEDDGILDPDVKKLKDEVKGLKLQNQKRDAVILEGMLKDAESGIKSEIAENLEKFPFVADDDGNTRKQLWDLLAQQNDDDTPTYSVKEAMAKLHGDLEKQFGKWVKKNPEVIKKKTEEDEQEIIARYLKNKGTKEEAPMSPPSEQAAGGVSKPAKTFGGIKDAISQFNVNLAAKKKAGKTT